MAIINTDDEKQEPNTGTRQQMEEQEWFRELSHDKRLEAIGAFHEEAKKQGGSSDYRKKVDVDKFDIRMRVHEDRTDLRDIQLKRYAATERFEQQLAAGVPEKKAFREYAIQQGILGRQMQQKIEREQMLDEEVGKIRLGTFGGRNPESPIGSFFGEVIQSATAKVGLGKENTFMGETPVAKMEEEAKLAEQRLKAAGFTDEDIANQRKKQALDEWKASQQVDKDDKDVFFVDRFGEVQFKPAALLRIPKDELKKIYDEQIKEDGYVEPEVARRGWNKVVTQKSEVLNQWARSHKDEWLKYYGDTFEDKINNYLTVRENAGEFNKFLTASASKILSAGYGVLGGTAAVFGGKDFMGATSLSQGLAASAEDLSMGSVAGFMSDIASQAFELLPARMGAKAGVSLFGKTATGATHGAAFASGKLQVGSKLFDEVSKKYTRYQNVGVGVGSGYSAASRVVGEARADGMEWGDAMALGLKQLIVTGGITYLGAGGGVERAAVGNTLRKETYDFLSDFVKKDIIGEGIEEYADELISGVLVAMEQDPSMTMDDVANGALQAFFMGMGAGGVMAGGGEVISKAVDYRVSQQLLKDLKLDRTSEALETSEDPVNGVMPSPAAGQEQDASSSSVVLTGIDSLPEARAAIADSGRNPDEFEYFPDGKGGVEAVPKAELQESAEPVFDEEGNVVVEPEAEEEAEPDKNDQADAQPVEDDEEAPPSKPQSDFTPAPFNETKKTNLGNGVVIEEAKDGPNLSTQVFGEAAPGKEMAEVDPKNITLKREKDGRLRVLFRRSRTDRVFNPKTKQFETDETGNVQYPARTLQRKKQEAFDETAPTTTPDKAVPETGRASSRFVAEGADNATQANRAAAVAKGDTAESIDRLESGDTKVNFTNDATAPQGFDPKTNQVTINPDTNPAILRNRVLPQVTAQKAAAQSKTEVDKIIEALGEERINQLDDSDNSVDDKVRMLVANALSGDVKDAKAEEARKALFEIMKDSSPELESQVVTLINSVQNAESGKEVRGILKTKTDTLVNKLRAAGSKIVLGEGTDENYAAPKSDLGVYAVEKTVFDRVLKKDSKGNPYVVSSNRKEDRGVLRKEQAVGSVIEVKDAKGEVIQRYVVKSTTRRFDGTVQHDVAVIGSDEAALVRASNALFLGNPDSKQRQGFVDLIQQMGSAPESEIPKLKKKLEALVRNAVEQMTSKEYADQKVQFVEDGQPGSANKNAWVDVAFDGQGGFRREPTIKINIDALYRKAQKFALAAGRKNTVLANSVAEDYDIFLRTMIYEEVAHEHALRELDQSEIMRMMAEWVDLADGMPGAKVMLADWFKYSQQGFRPEVAEMTVDEVMAEIQRMKEDQTPEGQEAYSNMLFGVGHEALAGFVQLLNTGNSSSTVSGMIQRYLSEMNASPLQVASTTKGEFASEDRVRTLIKRFQELALRMVESVRRFIKAHRAIRMLPPEFDNLVTQLDNALKKGGFKVPDPIDVKKRALAQIDNDLDASFKAFNANYPNAEARRTITRLTREIQRSLGVNPRTAIKMRYMSSGEAQLYLEESFAATLDDDTRAELEEALSDMNDSGQVDVVAKNIALAQDADLVLQRIGQTESQLFAQTEEEMHKNVAAARKRGVARLARILGTGSDFRNEFQNALDSYVDSQRRAALERANLPVDDVDFRSPQYGQEGRRYRQLQAAAIRAERAYSQTPSDSNSLGVRFNAMMIAREALEDYHYALLGQSVERSTAGGVDPVSRIPISNTIISISPIESPLAQTQLGLDLQRQMTSAAARRRAEMDIVERFPRLSVRPESLHTLYMAHRDKEGSNPIVDAINSEEFRAAFPAMDAAEAIRELENGSREIELTQKLHAVGEEVEFALLGGKPPSRILALSANTRDQWTSINMDAQRFAERVASFRLASILRTAESRFGTYAADITEHNRMVENKDSLRERILADQMFSDDPTFKQIKDLNDKLSKLRRSSPEYIAAQEQLKSMTDEINRAGLRIQFLNGEGDFALAMREGLPPAMALEFAGHIDNNGQFDPALVNYAPVLTDTEQTAYYTYGIDRIAYRSGGDSIDRDELRRITRNNARLLATNTTRQMIQRLFSGDRKVDYGMMMTGGFPLLTVMRRVGTDANDNPIMEPRAQIADDFFEIMDFPTGIHEIKDFGQKWEATIRSGAVANLILDVSAKLDRMENPTDQSDAAVMSTEFGLTPAGIVYQATSSPFLAFLARIKASGPEVMNMILETAGPNADRIKLIMAGLPPNIESAPEWIGETLPNKMFLNFLDLRNQVVASNLAYQTTMRELRTNRQLRSIQREAKKADFNGETESFDSVLDIDLAMGLMRENDMFADMRREAQEANPNYKGMIIQTKQDRATKLLSFWRAIDAEYQPLQLKSVPKRLSKVDKNGQVAVEVKFDEDNAFVARQDTNVQENLRTTPLEYIGEMRTSVENEVQKQQDQKNTLARIRTVSLMAIFGNDIRSVLHFVGDPQHHTTFLDADNNLQQDINYDVIDSKIIGMLEELAVEERQLGMVSEAERRRGEDGKIDPNRYFGDESIEQVLSGYPEDSAEAFVLRSVLDGGGSIHRNMPSDIVIEKAQGIEPTHNMSTRSLMTQVASLIPNLSFIKGERHHTSAQDKLGDTDQTVPSAKFVGDPDTPMLVFPFHYDSQITEGDMRTAIQEMMVYIHDSTDADIIGMAERILDPIREMMDGSGKARFVDHIVSDIRARMTLPQRPDDYDGPNVGFGMGRDPEIGMDFKEEELVKAHADVLWDRLRAELAKLTQDSRDTVANETLSLDFRGRNKDLDEQGFVHGLYDRLNTQRAAKVVANFMVSDNLKKILAYSSVGIQTRVNERTSAWSSLGDMLRADLLTFNENISIPLYMQELMAEFDAQIEEDVKLQEADLTELQAAKFGLAEQEGVVDHPSLARSIVEKKLDQQLSTVDTGGDVSFSLAMHSILPNGQDNAQSLLVTALSDLNMPFREVPQGIELRKGQAKLSKFEAMQAMGMFSDEEILEMAKADPDADMELLSSGNEPMTVEQLMNYNEAVADVIRNAYDRSMQSVEDDEGYVDNTFARRFGAIPPSESIWGKSRRGSYYQRNRIESGRYSAAVRYGVEHGESGDFVDLRDLGDNMEDFTSNLRQRLEEKGLPTSIPNPAANITKRVYEMRETMRRSPGFMSDDQIPRMIEEALFTREDIDIDNVGRTPLTADRIAQWLDYADRVGIDNVGQIDLVDEAWQKTRGDGQTEDQIIQDLKARIEEETRKDRALAAAYTRLEAIENSLITAEQRQQFAEEIRSGGVIDILNSDHPEAAKLLNKMVETYFGDYDSFVDALVDTILDRVTEASENIRNTPFFSTSNDNVTNLATLGLPSTMSLMEFASIPQEKFSQVSQSVVRRLGTFREQFKGDVKDVEARMMELADEIEEIRRNPDPNLDPTLLKRKERHLLAQVAEIKHWIAQTEQYVESSFGRGIIKRTRGLIGTTNTATVRDLHGAIRKLTNKLNNLHAEVYSILEPRGMIARLQDNAIAENLQEMSLSPNPQFNEVSRDFTARNLAAGETGYLGSFGAFGIDLTSPELNLAGAVRRALDSDNPQSVLRDAIAPHFKRDVRPLTRMLKDELDQLTEQIAADLVDGVGRTDLLLSTVARMQGRMGLTPREATKAITDAVRAVLAAEENYNEARIMELHHQAARQLIQNREFRPFISTYRTGGGRRVEIKGNPEQIEVFQRVMTRIGKLHANYYSEVYSRATDLRGLARLEAATRGADVRLVNEKVFEQAISVAMGEPYQMIDGFLVARDPRERVKQILEGRGYEATDEQISDAIEGFKLFSSAGLMLDNENAAVFSYKNKEGVEEKESWKATFDKMMAISENVFAKNLVRTKERPKNPLVYGELTKGEADVANKYLEGRDLFGEVQALPKYLYAFLLTFHEHLKQHGSEIRVSLDRESAKEYDSLRAQLNSFLVNTGADDHPDATRTVAPIMISQLLPLYAKVKAFQMTIQHAQTLEVGFHNVNTLIKGRMTKSLMHLDANIRSVFARTQEAQNVAHGIMGVLEFGPPTSANASFGRSGHFSLTDAIERAIGENVPKRRNVDTGVKVRGKDVGKAIETTDLEATNEAYFFQAIKGFLSSGSPIMKVNEMIEILEKAEAQLNAFESQNTLVPGNITNSARNWVYGSNYKALAEREVTKMLLKKYLKILRTIRNEGSTLNSIARNFDSALPPESAQYAEFLDNLFGYMKKVYQGQGQLIPEHEMDAASVDDKRYNYWANNGNAHLLQRSNVPFVWSRVWDTEWGIEGRDMELSDQVSMRGGLWLKNPNIEHNDDVIQILDLNGMRAPRKVLADMSYRLNVSPAFAVMQAVVGETEQNHNNLLQFRKNRVGALHKFTQGQNRRGATGKSTRADRLKQVSLAVSHMGQKIVQRDVQRGIASSRMQTAIEDIGRVGMGVTLTSMSHWFQQTLPGLTGYALIHGPVKRNYGVMVPFAKLASGRLLRFFHQKLGTPASSLTKYADDVERYIKIHARSIHLRHPEGVEIFNSAEVSARPRLQNLPVPGFSQNEMLHGIAKGLGATFDTVVKAPVRGTKKAIGVGLGVTIAAAEKSAINAVFIHSLQQRIKERLEAEGQDTSHVTVQNIVQGKFDHLTNTHLIGAKIDAVDIFAGSDTSLKGEIFQRSNSMVWELGRGLFGTFANHIIHTSTNSLAGIKMMINGADNQTRVAGARLAMTNLTQNALFHLTNYKTLVWFLSQALGALDDDDEPEAYMRAMFGLNDSEFAPMMQFISRYLLGENRPYGYDPKSGEFTEERYKKDASILLSKIMAEGFTQSGLRLSVASGTTLGGEISRGTMQFFNEMLLGIEHSSYSQAGISWGEGQTGNIPQKTLYWSSWLFRNYFGDRSYFLIGTNHLLSPLYEISNSEDMVLGDTVKLIPAMLPFAPRQLRSGSMGWNWFREDAKVKAWHDRYATSKGKSKKKRKGGSF